MDRSGPGEVADPAHADAALEPAPLPGPAPEPDAPVGEAPRQPPVAWIAQALLAPARAAGADGLIYVASSERRADEIGRALRPFAPDVEVLVLPPWDCLPYDRASPSRESMGRRMAVLARLIEPAEGPRVLVASIEALMQKVPPRAAYKGAFLKVAVGQTLPRAALEAFAQATGYVFDDRIDEPGEIAILGEVADVFPPAADAPVRISLGADDEVLEIKRYDPVSQRTEAPVPAVRLGPASELILDPADGGVRAPGAEHAAPQVYSRMETVLRLAGAARVAEDPRARARAADIDAQIQEAFEARRGLGDAAAPPPERLYLTAKALVAELDRRETVTLDGSGVEPVPNFALERNPGRAFSDYVAAQLETRSRVVLTGAPHELRSLVRAARRGLDLEAQRVEAWAEVSAAAPGGLLALTADVEAGFRAPAEGLVLVSPSDVLGGRAAARSAGGGPQLLAEPDLRVGDVVLHEDHGLGVLEALEPVEVDGQARDALRIAYHGGDALLAPIEEFGRIWRYGAEAGAVTLDRLHTDAWRKRRAELSREIDATAEHLVAPPTPASPPASPIRRRRTRPRPSRPCSPTSRPAR
jgi:transcription-repair coupling factor (superfamily II helicase)